MPLFKCCTVAGVGTALPPVDAEAVQAKIQYKQPCIGSLSLMLSRHRTGILIHRDVVLTSHGNIPNWETAVDAEIVLSYRSRKKSAALRTIITRRLQPFRYFLTDRELDLTLVACEPVTSELSPLPLKAKNGSSDILDAGRRIYILGHLQNSDMKGVIVTSPGRVCSTNDTIIKFISDRGPWSPGSAGFDEQGEFSFMVTDREGAISDIGLQRRKSLFKRDVVVQSGVPVYVIQDWMAMHGLRDLNTIPKQTQDLRTRETKTDHEDSLSRSPLSKASWIPGGPPALPSTPSAETLRCGRTLDVAEQSLSKHTVSMQNSIPQGLADRSNFNVANSTVITERAADIPQELSWDSETSSCNKAVKEEDLSVLGNECLESTETEGFGSKKRCSRRSGNMLRWHPTARAESFPMDVGCLYHRSSSFKFETQGEVSNGPTTKSSTEIVNSLRSNGIEQSNTDRHSDSKANLVSADADASQRTLCGQVTRASVVLAEEGSIPVNQGDNKLEGTYKEESGTSKGFEEQIFISNLKEQSKHLLLDLEPVESIQRSQTAEVEDDKEHWSNSTSFARLRPEEISKRIEGYGNVSMLARIKDRGISEDQSFKSLMLDIGTSLISKGVSVINIRHRISHGPRASLISKNSLVTDHSEQKQRDEDNCHCSQLVSKCCCPDRGR